MAGLLPSDVAAPLDNMSAEEYRLRREELYNSLGLSTRLLVSSFPLWLDDEMLLVLLTYMLFIG